MAFLTLLGTAGIAQQTYQVIQEPRTKILKGFITRDQLSGDTAYKWYQKNLEGYQPPTAAVESVKAKAEKVQYIVFGGTWCGDTRQILPKFFQLLDAAGVPQDKVTIIGVDRYKKAFGNLTEAMNIRYVPTIILLKDGVEAGRVIEYGKTGQWDKEVGEIAAGIK